MTTKSPYRVTSPILKEVVRCPPTVANEGTAQIFAAGVMNTTNADTDVDLEALCGRVWERVATAKVRNGRILRWRPL